MRIRSMNNKMKENGMGKDFHRLRVQRSEISSFLSVQNGSQLQNSVQWELSGFGIERGHNNAFFELDNYLSGMHFFVFAHVFSKCVDHRNQTTVFGFAKEGCDAGHLLHDGPGNRNFARGSPQDDM